MNNENIDAGIISAIFESEYYPIEVIGNLRMTKNRQQGLAIYQLNPHNDIDNSVLNYINSDETMLSSTIVLDENTIHNDEIIETLRKKIEEKYLKVAIRISTPNYTLTKEDYDRLYFFSPIIVDYIADDIQDAENVVLQLGMFKYDMQGMAQPVVERRKNFDDLVVRNCFHIDHKLTDEEFEVLANAINDITNPAIELNLFEPSYYEEFLRKLQEHNVKNNINICLIGYPLTDESRIYNELLNYPYEIDILYSTCHDMVERYTQEPYVENKLLYSQLEGGGKTSLSNYSNIIVTLEEFQTDVERMNLSPLETAVYAKQTIDSEYIYDPDYSEEDTDAWDNINLSQILNHNDGTNKRAVCLGFTTLYSVLLRKCNIPMFRYTNYGHSRNIGRIKDEKYGIDATTVFDLTNDLGENFEDSTYNYFGLAPRDMLKFIIHDNNYEIMTIASNLTIPREEYDDILPYTNDSYEQFYHPVGYEPLGYTIRMLELMGHIPNDQEYIHSYEEIYRLTKDGLLEGIDKDTLKKAVDTVLQKTGQNEEMRNHFSNVIDESFEIREYLFSSDPSIGGSAIHEIPTENPDDNRTYVRDSGYYKVTPLTQENINNYIENYNPENDIIYHNSNYIPNDNTQQSVVEEEPIIDETIIEETPVEEDEEDIEVNSQPIQEIEPSPNYTTEQPTNEATLDDMLDEYIPGTNIRKPRYRNLHETDEEYERFLENYYNRVFPQQESTPTNNITEQPTNEATLDDMLDEYIPGTNIRKPRYRRTYETDEEYERFLKNYYSRYFSEEQMNKGRR